MNQSIALPWQQKPVGYKWKHMHKYSPWLIFYQLHPRPACTWNSTKWWTSIHPNAGHMLFHISFSLSVSSERGAACFLQVLSSRVINHNFRHFSEVWEKKISGVMFVCCSAHSKLLEQKGFIWKPFLNHSLCKKHRWLVLFRWEKGDVVLIRPLAISVDLLSLPVPKRSL